MKKLNYPTINTLVVDETYTEAFVKFLSKEAFVYSKEFILPHGEKSQIIVFPEHDRAEDLYARNTEWFHENYKGDIWLRFKIDIGKKASKEFPREIDKYNVCNPSRYDSDLEENKTKLEEELNKLKNKYQEFAKGLKASKFYNPFNKAFWQGTRIYQSKSSKISDGIFKLIFGPIISYLISESDRTSAKTFNERYIGYIDGYLTEIDNFRTNLINAEIKRVELPSWVVQEREKFSNARKDGIPIDEQKARKELNNMYMDYVRK